MHHIHIIFASYLHHFVSFCRNHKRNNPSWKISFPLIISTYLSIFKCSSYIGRMENFHIHKTLRIFLFSGKAFLRILDIPCFLPLLFLSPSPLFSFSKAFPALQSISGSSYNRSTHGERLLYRYENTPKYPLIYDGGLWRRSWRMTISIRCICRGIVCRNSAIIN